MDALPFAVIGIVMAVSVGGGLSLILPKAYDFPSALLFMLPFS